MHGALLPLLLCVDRCLVLIYRDTDPTTTLRRWDFNRLSNNVPAVDTHGRHFPKKAPQIGSEEKASSKELGDHEEFGIGPGASGFVWIWHFGANGGLLSGMRRLRTLLDL